MQIIRRGNFAQGRTFQAECPHCTCLFRFSRSEASNFTQDGKFYISCPDLACGQSFCYTPKLHESQGEL